MRRVLPVLVVGLLLAMAAGTAPRSALTAQQPPPDRPKPAQTAPPERPTFRVEANYVRLDVYATKNGAPVTDLTADDFEILEDKAAQEITQFEYVRIRGQVPNEQRLAPSTVAESRALAEDPRRRIFVVFLDTDHTTLAGSHKLRRELIGFLERLVGPDDLVGVMTPAMSATDVTLSGRTGAIEDLLSRYWFWGRRDQQTNRDPEEAEYEMCYPERTSAQQCGSQQQPANYYATVAREMIERRREKRTLDALTDLVVWLQGIREERKAVLVFSSGWRLFRPNDALARMGACDAPPIGTPGVTPSGRLVGDRQEATGAGGSQMRCQADRMRLAAIDDDVTFRELFERANRSNTSFYTVDPRGLAVFDSSIEDTTVASDGTTVPLYTPTQDMGLLSRRIDSLRTLAENTDGLAVVNTNDLTPGLTRIAADLSSYYLLGYYSTNSALDGKFRKLTVRVKRPGVQVRTRSGYRALTKDDAARLTAANSAAATPAAAPAPLDVALGTLGLATPNLRVRTAVTRLTGTAGADRLWLVSEIDPAVARDLGGTANIEVSVVGGNGGRTIERTLTLPSGERVISVDLTDAGLPAGEHMVRVRVTPGTGLPLSETSKFVVPATEDYSGTVRVLRRGPATGLAYVPTADPRFRRAERIRLEHPRPGAPTAVSAELLDRRGQPMTVPVTTSTRAEGDLAWAVAEVTLAPLAPGDYLIRLKTTDPGGTHETLTAFKVVP